MLFMREIPLKGKYIKSTVCIFILWENLSKKIILTILAVKLKAGFTAFFELLSCPEQCVRKLSSGMALTLDVAIVFNTHITQKSAGLLQKSHKDLTVSLVSSVE